jgi:hypothetical protein
MSNARVLSGLRCKAARGVVASMRRLYQAARRPARAPRHCRGPVDTRFILRILARTIDLSWQS